MESVFASVQLFIFFSKESFKNAVTGILDSFRWTYISVVSKIFLVLILLFSLGVFCLSEFPSA